MKVKKVFYQKGKFDNDAAKRFLEAPLELVVIPGLSPQEFVQPRSIFNALDKDTLNLTGFADGSDEAIYRDGEGYATMDTVVLSGEHEMGCFQDPDAAWKGVHRMSWF
jgi:hypothetical protein